MTNPKPIKITKEEWLNISTSLEEHHAVFYKLWQMGKPIFNEDLPTACVQFDEVGEFVYFHFNPTFWSKLPLEGKLFVICHEALHIILNHGLRIRDSGVNRPATNSALDIVVNHLLVRSFGFNRKSIDYIIKPIFQNMHQEKFDENQGGLCWVDTIFKDKKPMPPDNEMYEYYYNLFEKVYGDGGAGDGTIGNGGSLDDHSMMGKGKGKSDDWDKLIDKLSQELTEDEKAPLKNIIDKHFDKKELQKAGTETGGQWVFANTGRVIKKKKWETVIKNWAKKYIQNTSKDQEQWARLNRRMVFLPKNTFLPSEMEIEDLADDKRKIQVFFFLDTSGSCWGLKDRFFTAAESLPNDRFDVRLFCFDTVVKETTLESKKIYGGGGTAFDIIEKHIQSLVTQEGIDYPKAVWLLSDGEANYVKPEKPENWYFFLTRGGTKHYIPKESYTFNLEDFE